MAEFRILSLDGGGSWALIEVMALMDLFGGADVKGHEVLRRFDLIAANSGGAIVLGALAKNMSLGELFDLIANKDTNKRRTIFADLGFFSDVTDHLARTFGIGARYDTQKKLEGLTAILGADGNRQVESLPDWIGVGKRNRKPQLVICAFDYDATRARFFRSDPQSLSGSFGQHGPVSLVQAVHASANPPVNFFNNPTEFGDRRYWDGGIGGYNNPTLAAVIEAVANAGRYNTSIPEIKVLSLGTGNVVLPFLRVVPSGQKPVFIGQKESRSLKNDILKLATSILDDPPDAASFHAHILLGGRLPANPGPPVGDGPIVRMNPLIQPVRDADDKLWVAPPGLDEESFKRLCKLDLAADEQTDVDLIRDFANAWLNDGVLNQPIRATGDSLTVEIGHRSYRDAKAQAIIFDF
jgi:hypothetical protein